MKTGWKRRPSKLSDRVDADNNTLMETWTSNVGKMDMDEASCNALRDAVKFVRLSKPHLYDPSRALDPMQMVERSADVEIEGLTSDDVAAQSSIMSMEIDAAAVTAGQDEEEQGGETEGVQADEMEEDQGGEENDADEG